MRCIGQRAAHTTSSFFACTTRATHPRSTSPPRGKKTLWKLSTPCKLGGRVLVLGGRVFSARKSTYIQDGDGACFLNMANTAIWREKSCCVPPKNQSSCTAQRRPCGSGRRRKAKISTDYTDLAKAKGEETRGFTQAHPNRRSMCALYSSPPFPFVYELPGSFLTKETKRQRDKRNEGKRDY